MVEPTVTAAPTEALADGRRVSPAAHLAERFAAAEVTGPRAVRIRETAFLTMVGVRSTPGSAVAARIETRLGAPLPAACGAVTTGEGVSVLWLSPDEFLVVTADEQPAQLTSRLIEALEDEPGSVIDLSANRTTFELAGPSARAVLEKGCPAGSSPPDLRGRRRLRDADRIGAGRVVEGRGGVVPDPAAFVFRRLPGSLAARRDDRVHRWGAVLMAPTTNPMSWH